MDAFTTHVDYSSLKIDTQLRAFELRKRFFRTGPPQSSSNACQEFAHCEGFYDVIVSSGIERVNLVLFRISDSDHDDGTREVQSNLAACLKPAHAGHIHIHENQSGALAIDHLDGFLTVLGLDDAEAAPRRRSSQPT